MAVKTAQQIYTETMSDRALKSKDKLDPLEQKYIDGLAQIEADKVLNKFASEPKFLRMITNKIAKHMLDTESATE